jgi:hypothetical protein
MAENFVVLERVENLCAVAGVAGCANLEISYPEHLTTRSQKRYETPRTYNLMYAEFARVTSVYDLCCMVIEDVNKDLRFI